MWKNVVEIGNAVSYSSIFNLLNRVGWIWSRTKWTSVSMTTSGHGRGMDTKFLEKRDMDTWRHKLIQIHIVAKYRPYQVKESRFSKKIMFDQLILEKLIFSIFLTSLDNSGVIGRFVIIFQNKKSSSMASWLILNEDFRNKHVKKLKTFNCLIWNCVINIGSAIPD